MIKTYNLEQYDVLPEGPDAAQGAQDEHEDTHHHHDAGGRDKDVHHGLVVPFGNLRVDANAKDDNSNQLGERKKKNML